MRDVEPGGGAAAPAGRVRPRYQEIEQELAARIRRGELAAGGLVPSERRLCEDFRVSTITARRALLELTRRGLIYRLPGMGSFVADPGRRRRLSLAMIGFDGVRWRNSAGPMGELVGGVSEAAWRHDCPLQVLRLDQSLDDEVIARLIEEWSEDGLLLRPAGDVAAAHVDALERAGIPYVLIRRYVPGRPTNCVVPDDGAGLRLALSHLANLGHRRIGFISAAPELVQTRDRVAAYLAAADQLGLDRDERLIRLAGHYAPELGYACARELLTGPDPATAAVVSVVMVPGLYRAAADLGLDIPRDLAVVGYDEAPEGRGLVPPLTCVRTSHYEAGQLAVETLLELLAGRATAPCAVQMEPTLDVRASSGARAGTPAGRER